MTGPADGVHLAGQAVYDDVLTSRPIIGEPYLRCATILERHGDRLLGEAAAP
jgi:hypothetical protein